MGRLSVVLLFSAVIVAAANRQNFFGGIRPVFILRDPATEGATDSVEAEVAPAPTRGRSDLPIEDDEEESDSGELPEGFGESVERNLKIPQQHRRPLYGDPGDFEEEERSGGQARLIWPFSLSVSKGHGHDHHHGPPHGHAGFGPPPHLSGPWSRGPHGDDDYEKKKLKYEVYKLKAKKKLAILQNKIELKKILTILLQQKIKALEWWA